jgi:hypothetical protein
MLSACASSSLYAGTMGPVSTVSPTFRPFIIGEAAYSWPEISGININFTNLAKLNSNAQTQGWGGRLGMGVMRSISERFALSFEGGLMYNDHVNLQPVFQVTGAQVTPSTSVIHINFDQYGFDLLGGIVYTRPKYELFFKAGALFENMRTHLGLNMNKILTNNTRQSTFTANTTQALNLNIGQVMPEIKLGGGYHVTDNWSVTAAWMHAFGGTMGVNSDNISLSSGSVSISNIGLSLNNPTINSVMFGVEYLFS